MAREYARRARPEWKYSWKFEPTNPSRSVPCPQSGEVAIDRLVRICVEVVVGDRQLNEFKVSEVHVDRVSESLTNSVGHSISYNITDSVNRYAKASTRYGA